MKKMVLILAISGLLILTGGIANEVEALSGTEILNQLDETMRADNKYMEQNMIIVSAGGSERSRDMAIWSSVENDTEKMLVRFLTPADVAGTGLLLEDDDMWLYLPALNNIRRISGSARQGDFMGSDLTYEDMESLGTAGFGDDYEADLTDEVIYEEREAFLLELKPIEADSSYSKLEIKVDSEYWLPLKIDYYEEDELVKTLVTSEHAVLDGRWTAQRLEMSDHRDGTRTILIVNEVDYSSEVKSEIFTTRNLERGQ